MRHLLAIFATLVIVAPASAQHHNEHHAHRNSFGLFAGLTHEDRRDNAFTVGAEYARTVGQRLTVGALAEHAFGDHSFWVLAVPFGYKIGQWRAVVAPGVELADSGSHNLVRLGIDYALVAESWEIAPTFALDFVEEDVVPIYGVVFARGF